jgi:hypothetical protein
MKPFGLNFETQDGFCRFESLKKETNCVDYSIIWPWSQSHLHFLGCIFMSLSLMVGVLLVPDLVSGMFFYTCSRVGVNHSSLD